MNLNQLNSILFTLLFLGVNNLIFSQTVFFNNGQNIIFSDNVLFIIKEGTLINEEGLIQNEGHVYVEGNFVNNSQTEGGNPNSDFHIKNDWENNSIFNANQSTVFLYGTNQNIKGIEESEFHNLTLENGHVKSMDINSQVDGILKLNISELATQEFKMLVSNPNSNAVEFVQNTGFVSSSDNGRFVRNTNSYDSYVFPTGENIGAIKYRPIRIQPKDIVSSQYEVRFVNANADYDGYDYDLKDENIKNFNESFYHLINQSLGNTSSRLSVFYNPLEDGDWTSIAQWDEKWNGFNGTNKNNFGNLEEVSYNNWKSNSKEPHILINTEECRVAVPTGFSPDNSGKNDFFKTIKTCNFSSFELKVYNRWGELVFITTNENVFWDGTYKGYNADIGVYTWNLDYTTNGKNKHEDGTITLLR